MAARKEAPAEQPEEQAPNAVVVVKNVNEDGTLAPPTIQLLGEVQITEAQFLLEAGIKGLRRELGFDV